MAVVREGEEERGAGSDGEDSEEGGRDADDEAGSGDEEAEQWDQDCPDDTEHDDRMQEGEDGGPARTMVNGIVLVYNIATVKCESEPQG